MQDPDGEWREDVLAALDFVVEAARAHGIRVMLSFADNWKYIGEAPLHEYSADVSKSRKPKFTRPSLLRYVRAAMKEDVEQKEGGRWEGNKYPGGAHADPVYTAGMNACADRVLSIALKPCGTIAWPRIFANPGC